MPQIALVNPSADVAPEATAPATLAPRLDRLQGKTIALMDNTKGNADVLMAACAKRLVEDYRCQVVHYRKPLSSTVPFTPDVIDDVARRCHAVITGIGD